MVDNSGFFINSMCFHASTWTYPHVNMTEDEKDLYIEQLKEENKKLVGQAAVLTQNVDLLTRNVELLTQALLHAQKQRFGASSEKTRDMEGQVGIFGDDYMGGEDGAADEGIKVKEHKRPLRKKGDRSKSIDGLPVETVECILDPDEAVCGICGSGMKVIGKKKVRSEVQYIPASLKVVEYVQYAYGCPDCGRNDENPDYEIKSSPVLSHSYASASIAAWVMYMKYVLSVPLYRQERDFARMGLTLGRDMMASWMIRTAQYWLESLYDRMHAILLTYDIIMCDETTWQVNKEKSKAPSSKSYIWIYRSGSYGRVPIILYEYTRSRNGDHAGDFLKGLIRCCLVSDGYAGYEKVKGIIRCMCFSHLRRYFIDAVPLDSKKKEIPGSGGAAGRAYCDKLFKLERKWKNLLPDERKRNRLLFSVPVLDAFFAWAETVVTFNEPLKTAAGCLLNHREYFTNFLLDGRIPISNNLSEQAVKPVAINRKNSLFSDSVSGAEASATIFSIINTAVANGLDPYKYLKYIFTNLPSLGFVPGDSVLDDYLPWSEQVKLACDIPGRVSDQGKDGENYRSA